MTRTRTARREHDGRPRFGRRFVHDLARRPASSAPCPALRARGTACSCPGCAAPPRSTRQCASGSKMQTSAGCADGEVARRRCPITAAGSLRDARERRRQRHAVLGRPLERQRQQQFEPGRAGLRLGERHLLAVVVDRRVVRADASIVPSATPARSASRSRVPRSGGTRWRAASNQPMSMSHRCRWWTATSQVTGRPVAPSPRAPCATPSARRQPAQVHAHAGLAHEREDRRQRDRLGDRRNRRQAEPRRDLAVVRDAAAAEVRILRPQPDAIAEGRRVLHRAQQHLRVDERRVGLRERDAAGLGELAHLGQRVALRAARSARRPDRRAPGSSERARCLSISTRPGSSSGGSVSGGQARLVTPPATAASISDSSVALYSKPGSRSRAERSTEPGHDDEPRGVDARGWRASPPAPRRSPAILPAAM